MYGRDMILFHYTVFGNRSSLWSEEKTCHVCESELFLKNGMKGFIFHHPKMLGPISLPLKF